MARAQGGLRPRSPKGGRPTREVAEQLPEHIAESALAVLVEHGPEGFTMDLVAERAHTSKKTLYSHFSSKDELLATVLNRTLDRQVWPDRARADDDLPTQLYATLTAILHNTFKPEVVALERAFVAYPALAQQARVRAAREVPVNLLVGLLEQARQRGEATFDDARVVAYLLLDALVLGPRTRFLLMTPGERAAFDLDASNRITFAALWRGLAPRQA